MLGHETQDTFSYVGEQNESVTVLVIDDDKWVQRVTSTFLQSWGLKTYSAYDPVEGIAFAANKQPNLIILDIVLPDFHGDLILKILKKLDATAEIPIIILSGNLDKSILGKTYKDGAAGFITKPFTKDILLEKLIEVLDPAHSAMLNLQEIRDSGHGDIPYQLEM